MSEQTIVGVFHTHEEAKEAVRALKSAGFEEETIGVLSPAKPGDFQEQANTNLAGKGAAVGAGVGLGTGALWGMGIAAGMLPAVGPVIVGGTMAAIIASAASTAAAGGVLGALIATGLSDQEAEYYKEEFEHGRTLVTVKCDDAYCPEARRILAAGHGRQGLDYEHEYAERQLENSGPRASS